VISTQNDNLSVNYINEHRGVLFLDPET